MDILIWAACLAFFIALIYSISFLIQRFYTKIAEENLGRIFFMPGKHLLISCTILFYISTFGFFILIGDCSLPKVSEEFQTIIWECSKENLAKRGNQFVISYAPLLLATTVIIAFLRRLLNRYNLAVAMEIAFYSFVFILTLPLAYVLALMFAVDKAINEQAKEDMEIERKARVAHGAVQEKSGPNIGLSGFNKLQKPITSKKYNNF